MKLSIGKAVERLHSPFELFVIIAELARLMDEASDRWNPHEERQRRAISPTGHNRVIASEAFLGHWEPLIHYSASV